MARKLWEIDQDILSCVDEETGEIFDPERLNSLEIERDEKIEGTVNWIRDLKNQSDSIKAEIDRLKKLKDSTDKRLEGVKKWVSEAVGYKPYSPESGLWKITFRASETCEIDDEAIIPKDFVEIVETAKIRKDDLKKALKAGAEIPGAHIEPHMNIQIK